MSRIHTLLVTVMALAAAPAALSAQSKATGVSITASTGASVSGDSLEVGNKAPAFALPWADKAQIGATDHPFKLADAAGKPVVLAFYPKDFTSGCTAEMTTFTTQYNDLFGPDVVVVGISIDSLDSHRAFADSLKAPFKLLSDPDQRVAKIYASAGPNGYDKRTVYVIGRNGKIAYRNMAFGAVDPQAYADLKEAVAKARK